MALGSPEEGQGNPPCRIPLHLHLSVLSSELLCFFVRASLPAGAELINKRILRV